MSYETLAIARQGSVARVNLDRPQVRNAMNQQMVHDLLDYFTSIQEERSIRAVVLAANGPTFCAGGDIKEMQAGLTADRQTQRRHVERFDAMLTAVNQVPQVVIARVQGPALGGGLGLVCVADVAVAAHEAMLGFPEVRLGLVPSVISPYVVARIGLTRARQLMLTGARLNGTEAAAAGLVTTACAAAELDERVNGFVKDVLQASPLALAACKALLFEVSENPLAQTVDYRVDLLSRLRASEEGQEGMMAFMQKRKPSWVEEGPA